MFYKTMIWSHMGAISERRKGYRQYYMLLSKVSNKTAYKKFVKWATIFKKPTNKCIHLTSFVNPFNTAFTRKDLGIRVEDTVEGDVEVKVLSITDAGKAAAEAGKVEDKELSANAKTVLNYLADGKEVTLEELAEAVELDKKVVNGTFNGLVRKELCERTIKTGKGPVPVKYLRLTDEGLAYDPDASEEA